MGKNTGFKESDIVMTDNQSERLKNDRNNCNMWRVIATLMIAVLHTGIRWNNNTIGWYIMVDFFFMLSGFLLIKGVYDGRYDYSVWHYTKKRIVRLYPNVIFSFFVLFIYSAFNGYSIGGVVSQLYGHLCEILPFLYTFRQAAVYTQPMNYTAWYVDALLIDSMVVFYMLKNHRKCFIEIGMITIAFIGLAYINHTHNNFYEGGNVWGCINISYIRGLADMCLGCIAYVIVNKVRGRLTKTAYVFARIIEYFGFCFVIAASFFMGYTTIDFSYVLIIFVSLICMNLYESNTVSDLRPIRFLSRISYSVYLNQLFVIVALPRILHVDSVADNAVTMILYLCILIAYSAITDWIVNYIVRKCKEHSDILFVQVK